MSQRTAVYRLFDAERTLLYIGMSKHPLRRVLEHMIRQPWRRSINSWTIEWHPDPDTAHAAEVEAIHSERPLWNISDSPWRATLGEDGRYTPQPKPVCKPRPSVDPTPDRHFRATTPLWQAYGSVCQRRGRERSADLMEMMRRTVARYGNEEEKALLEKDRAEVRARRARKGGRPPRAPDA